ncbi:XylR N-terminal domain-containing protein [Nannocystis pusilla]|uniref:XylR N-terminal domain-containing protein n=1 Tax=Nannocystis pusilla TaxID=889268 RepID=UPI003B79ED42
MRAEDLDIDTLLLADAEVGALHFAGHRAVIVDAAALGTLRRELMAALGPAGARALLSRFGQVQGRRAGEAMRGRFEWDSELAIRDAGGRVGILQGMLRLLPGTGPMMPEGRRSAIRTRRSSTCCTAGRRRSRCAGLWLASPAGT